LHLRIRQEVEYLSNSVLDTSKDNWSPSKSAIRISLKSRICEKKFVTIPVDESLDPFTSLPFHLERSLSLYQSRPDSHPLKLKRAALTPRKRCLTKKELVIKGQDGTVTISSSWTLQYDRRIKQCLGGRKYYTIVTVK
jgi:hypothetical protein